MTSETHRALVRRAARWLRNSRRCTVVLSETMAWWGCEIPDAIGWTARGRSTLVECKVSREDLLRDRKKICARRGLRLGADRFFLFPYGLAGAVGDVLAEHYQGWGVLEVRGKQLRRFASPVAERLAGAEDRDTVGEIQLLMMAGRRQIGWAPTVSQDNVAPASVERGGA